MDAFSFEDINRYNSGIENKNRGALIQAHIADIHFGSIDAKTTYEILYEQFILELYKLPRLDCIFINGDLFHKKYPNAAASNEILYTSIFLSELRNLAINKNATVVILLGTRSHDNDQLSLFYHYMYDKDFDIRIVENISFEYIKGAKVLCIPEVPNISDDTYDRFLFNEIYDQCVLHGTMKGSVYGNHTSKNCRLFTIEDFCNCRGPIMAGHVHVAGCFNSHFYYTGSAIRWQHGEEDDKGFMINLLDLDTGMYCPRFITIESFKYRIVKLDDLFKLSIAKPEEIIKYLDELKVNNNIDYIRIDINNINSEDLEILRTFYSTDNTMKIKINDKKDGDIGDSKSSIELYNKYSYIFDKDLTQYEILSRYINDKEGYIFITSDQLKKVIEDEKYFL